MNLYLLKAKERNLKTWTLNTETAGDKNILHGFCLSLFSKVQDLKTNLTFLVILTRSILIDCSQFHQGSFPVSASNLLYNLGLFFLLRTLPSFFPLCLPYPVTVWVPIILIFWSSQQVPWYVVNCSTKTYGTTHEHAYACSSIIYKIIHVCIHITIDSPVQTPTEHGCNTDITQNLRVWVGIDEAEWNSSMKEIYIIWLPQFDVQILNRFCHFTLMSLLRERAGLAKWGT